ncbi:MAG: YiiX family permuted papain-like enzyme [Thermoanaerobaculales bacterium]|jgi:hypothetical protein|nr:YiiX family permuted papain-like enzyme [Thermoanaerobaculales bacterium]
MKKVLIAITLLLSPTTACSDLGDYEPRDGDIVFQVSRSDQSRAIEIVTGSRYSHMGIVYLEDGQARVFEAVGPVISTPFEDWVDRGVGGHVVVKRLAAADGLLDAEALQRMAAAGRELAGLPYDFRFEWSDDRIYCSELVWKIYHRGLGVRLTGFETVSDFDLDDPEVRTIVDRRWPHGVPKKQRVVSPAAIFASSHLVTVFEN